MFALVRQATTNPAYLRAEALVFAVFLLFPAAFVFAWYVVPRFIQLRRRGEVSWNEARKIMGQNFFSVPAAFCFFGEKLSHDYVRVFKRVPFLRGTLKDCKDTHVLVAVLPVSFKDIQELVADRVASYRSLYVAGPFFDLDRTERLHESFLKDRGASEEIGWHLIRREPVATSRGRTLREQGKFVEAGERMLSARILAYAIMGYFFATDEWLFRGYCVRSSSFNRMGERVCVGEFDPHSSVHFYGVRDDVADSRIGLATEREPDLLLRRHG